MEKPGLRPIGPSLRVLTESSRGCLPSTSRSNLTDPARAVERAKLLAGCYRKAEASDPETYAGAIAAILSNYPPDIVQQVTDPRSGLPSRSQWLPTVKEVRDACDAIAEHQAAALERERRIAEQFAAREREEKSRANRPTLEELRAKYGPNWGMNSNPKAEEIEREQNKLERLKTANRAMFAAECEAAGMPSDSLISPSLAKILETGRF
jgi:hypothetical protein